MPEDLSQDSRMVQSCPDCAALLDMSEEEPLSTMNCPVCGASVQVLTQFNNFVLQKQVGLGGMGAVYKALDLNLNRLVALKVVLKQYGSDPAYHEKFEHEAKMTALVNHPHVVKVFSFGSDHGFFYIAMELVEKGSLDDLITLQKQLPEGQVLEIGIQIAEGLRAALGCGLIHRDVKPGNILFADHHTAKIVDFGLALPMEQSAEAAAGGGEIWGTPYYIAPEKLNRETEDFRSDIYSLGASLFHALAGRPTFEGETNSISVLRRLKSQEVSLQSVAPEVSSATAYVINRSLRVKPQDRHQSYDDLIEHLNYARTQLLEQKTGTVSGPVVQANWRSKRTGVMIVALVVSVVLVLIHFRPQLNHGAPPKHDQTNEGGLSKSVAGVTGVEEKYRGARKELLRGDVSGAQKVFHELIATGNLPHPFDRWVMLHEGLCALLDGHLPEAQKIFAKMHQIGLYSSTPEERSLANFFVSLGSTAVTGELIPGSAKTQYNIHNYETLSVFLSALNDWELSRFDEANSLFHAFAAIDPKPPYEWILEYESIAQRYIADFDGFDNVTKQIKSADTLPKETEALQNLHTFQTAIQVPGRLREKVSEMESELQGRISAEQAGIAAAKADEERRTIQSNRQHEMDTKTVSSAGVKFASFMPGYQFSKGLESIEKTEVLDPDASKEFAALLKKGRWLLEFKQTVINDINTAGYPLPVSKLHSAPIEGGVRVAGDTQLEIHTPYGTVLVSWSDLPPKELLAMAGYFIKLAGPNGGMADRMWLAGVFAVQYGMTREGHELLDKAAQSKSDYKDVISLFGK